MEDMSMSAVRGSVHGRFGNRTGLPELRSERYLSAEEFMDPILNTV